MIRNSGLVDTEAKDDELRPLLAARGSTAAKQDDRSQKQRFNPASLGRYTSMVAMVLCTFFNYAAFSLLAPFYPQVVAEKKGTASDTEVGVVLGSINVAAFIASIVFGRYMHKIGTKFLVVAGAFIVGGSTLIFGFVCDINNWIAFIALSSAIRFVMGVGEGAFDTTSIAIGLTMFPARTATVWSIFEVAAGLGIVTGPPLGGFLYDTHGFLIPFIVVGSAILLSAIFLTGFIPNITKATDESAVSVWPLLKILPIMMACLSVFWSSAALGMLTTTLSIFLERSFQWSPTKISTTILTNSAVYGVSALVFGRLADATNPRALLIAGMVFRGCGLLLIGPAFIFTILTPKPWLVYISMASMGLGGAAIQVSVGLDIIQSATARGYQDDSSLYGCVSGLVLGSMFLAQAVGSPVGGLLTVKFGFRYSTSFMAFIVLAQAAASLVMTIAQSRLPISRQITGLSIN